MRFADIYGHVQSRIALDDTDTLAIIKREINMVQRDIETRLPEAYWTRAERNFNTVASVSAGTASVTQGSVNVTFSGNKQSILVGAWFQVDGDDQWYRIKRWNSATSLDLEHPYIGSTDASASYLIYKAEYSMPGDLKSIRYIVDTSIPTKLAPLRDRDVTYGIPDLFNDGDKGQPYAWWWSDLTSEGGYATGTVTVTQGSTAVTGDSTSWDATSLVLPSETFKLDREDEEYVIDSSASATALTLNRPYLGASGSGLAYQISPRGQQRIVLYPIPTTARLYRLSYHRRLPDLVADDDQSIIPEQFHHVILKGTEARMLMHVGMDYQARDAQSEYMQLVLGEMRDHALSHDTDHIWQMKRRPDFGFLYRNGPRFHLPGNYEPWTP